MTLRCPSKKMQSDKQRSPVRQGKATPGLLVQELLLIADTRAIQRPLSSSYSGRCRGLTVVFFFSFFFSCLRLDIPVITRSTCHPHAAVAMRTRCRRLAKTTSCHAGVEIISTPILIPTSDNKIGRKKRKEKTGGNFQSSLLKNRTWSDTTYMYK